MGILTSLSTEIEKLNPANMVAEIESLQADLQSALSRVATLESSVASTAATVGPMLLSIESAIPGVPAEVGTVLTTVLAALKALTPAVPAAVATK
jgi:hypothetical protein